MTEETQARGVVIGLTTSLDDVQLLTHSGRLTTLRDSNFNGNAGLSTKANQETKMISTAAKATVIKSNQHHAKDCGSTEVQVAILTERINSLQDHFKAHSKDHAGRRGLLLMVSKRNSLLRYIAETNREGYASLIKKLGLRK